MLNREVGFALNNGHRQPSLSGPKSAKTGKAPCEHMFSAVHLTTDIAKILRHVRFVPQAGITCRRNGQAAFWGFVNLMLVASRSCQVDAGLPAKHKCTQHRCRADVVAVENADGLTGCVEAGNRNSAGVYDFGLRGHFQPAESKVVGRDDRKATERWLGDWSRPIGFCGQECVGALVVELACVPGARWTY